MAKFITFYDMSATAWTTLNTDTISKICLGEKECIIIDVEGEEYEISTWDYERIVRELSIVNSGWEKDLQWIKDKQEAQIEESKLESTNADI
jgi:hypothetical protein